MGVKKVQSNLTAGELSETLHNRIDLEKYNHGVADATNMVILPHGGMRRRPGLSKLDDGVIGDESKSFPFVFNIAQKYVIILTPGFIDVFKDGVLVAGDIVSPYLTYDIIEEVDAVQSADTMILVHESIEPYKLMRQGDDVTWDMSAITFVEIPVYDFGSGDEPVWSATRGYPRCCTFFQGRLWLAGSTEKPNSIWGSKINGFFDFGLGTSLDDEGIFDTFDTDQYYIIETIFAGRTLQVFTSGGEFVQKSKVVTPTDSTWEEQTTYGAKKIRPISIDGATLFVDSSNRTVRQFLYSYDEDGYVSINLSLLSSHLLTNVKAMAAIKGTEYDVSDFVYVINEDGTVAVLNTMRHENITGWTHWETDGLFKDVCVIGKEVYFTVYRNGNYFLEKLQEGTYTDHNVYIDGAYPETFNLINDTDNIIHGINNVVWEDISTGVATTSLDTNYEIEFADTEFKVIADYSIMEDSQYVGTAGSNTISIERDAYRLETGLNFLTKVTTLPLNGETRAGMTLFERKRVVKVDISVVDSLGVYANDLTSPDRSFVVALDEAPDLFTGFREMHLLGYNRITEIEIKQEEPLPFILRALAHEVTA